MYPVPSVPTINPVSTVTQTVNVIANTAKRISEIINQTTIECLRIHNEKELALAAIANNKELGISFLSCEETLIKQEIEYDFSITNNIINSKEFNIEEKKAILIASFKHNQGDSYEIKRLM